MIYWYMDNLRMQMWFDSPNHCASFWVMTIMICIGGFLLFVDKKKFLAWGFFGAAILQEVLLSMTYSRGGYISLIAGVLPLNSVMIA